MAWGLGGVWVLFQAPSDGSGGSWTSGKRGELSIGGDFSFGDAPGELVDFFAERSFIQGGFETNMPCFVSCWFLEFVPAVCLYFMLWFASLPVF